MLNTELFTEQYEQFKQHLHIYLKEVLLYDDNNKIFDNMCAFFISSYCLMCPVKLCLPQEVNDKQITNDMNIMQTYKRAYDRVKIIKRYHITQTAYENAIRAEINNMLVENK